MSSDYLNKEVELIESYDILPKGSIGLCTADLPEMNIFAVIFKDFGWISFQDKTIKTKFRIYINDN